MDPLTFIPEPGDVIMAPHLLNRAVWPRFDREGVTFYETENLLCPTNPWRDMTVDLRASTARPWMNYSKANAAVYGDEPRLLTPRQLNRPEVKRDIDVLFVGTLTSRRNVILDALRTVGLNMLRIGTEAPVFMPELANILDRTKVLLNIHYHVPGVFESFRCIPAISHGAIVVTEQCVGGEGAGHCVVCPYGQLVDTVLEVLYGT